MNLVWEPLIAAILALTNFSIKANPKAPDGAAVLEHAVEDADFVFHVDWRSTVADNYTTFTKLPDDPMVKQVPELQQAMRQAITQAEGARAMAKSMVGIDPITDLTSITGYAKVGASGQPEFLIVTRGTFAADLPARIAKTAGGKESKIDGRSAASMPDGTMMGISKSGALLVGKGDWVAPRLEDEWKAPARGKGSTWARIATSLDARPFFLFAAKASAPSVKQLTADMQPSFGRDLVTNHDLVVVAASATGIGWIYQAKDADFAKRMKTASEGLIELMRAAHIAPRGFAQLVAASLQSYKGTSKGIDAVIASKDKLMTAMWDMTGDGKFKADVKLDGKTVVVTATGKRVSEVVPAGMLFGLGALGFVSSRGESAPAMPPARATPPAQPVKPRSSGGIGAPVKKPAAAPN